jgi:NADH-quinone oxidoreductase subunit J
METPLFYLFSALTLGSALAVVINKNTVNAALSLLLSLVGVAGIFALLDALLLAVLLILVYAGAVVALFLFIVMLLDEKGSPRKPFKAMSSAAAVIATVILGLGVASLATRAQLPATPATEAFQFGLKDYGVQLFTTYLLPVQVVGFLLLIAMMGVIVLSKRFDNTEATK